MYSQGLEGFPAHRRGSHGYPRAAVHARLFMLHYCIEAEVSRSRVMQASGPRRYASIFGWVLGSSEMVEKGTCTYVDAGALEESLVRQISISAAL
jgi:hypothetical protein